jgi:hypothetical protein
MRVKLLILALFIGSVLVCAVGWQTTMAQEETYILAHEDVFGSLRRPQVDFSHESHTESLEDGGCGLCHHTPDENTGRLAYVEGDERTCKECHGLEKEGTTPALREAYHGNCTGCHRDQIKSGIQSGPTTCGECHR